MAAGSESSSIRPTSTQSDSGYNLTLDRTSSMEDKFSKLAVGHAIPPDPEEREKSSTSGIPSGSLRTSLGCSSNEMKTRPDQTSMSDNTSFAPLAHSESSLVCDTSLESLSYSSENGLTPSRLKLNPSDSKITPSVSRAVYSHSESEPDFIHHIGHKENTSKCVRIVHLSDTHMEHDSFLDKIPAGDILVHSGDFVNFYSYHDIDHDIYVIDEFFAKLPHKHKIFVAGNHERSFQLRQRQLDDQLLEHAVYLQDSSITVEGIKIYGSPWNTSRGMAFYSSDLVPIWDKVPRDTDILVTHSPPFGILDYGFNKFWQEGDEHWLCDLCTTRNSVKANVYHGEYAHQGCCRLRKAIFDRLRRNRPKVETNVYHGKYAHQGCCHLRKAIFDRLRPKAHLFGHVHNHNGIHWEDGILFSNASMMCEARPVIIDYHISDQSTSPIRS